MVKDKHFLKHNYFPLSYLIIFLNHLIPGPCSDFPYCLKTLFTVGFFPSESKQDPHVAFGYVFKSLLFTDPPSLPDH